MSTALLDIKYSLRVMRRYPLVVLGAIGSIALGVGANAATFSAVYTAVFKPLPFESADRLVYVGRSSPDMHGPERLHWSYPRFLDVVEHNRGTFARISAVADRTFMVRVRDATVRMRGQFVTSDYFGLFGITPRLGRFPGAAGDANPRNAVVISHELWRSQFSADPAAIGNVLQINGRMFVVTGIAPAGFGGLDGQARLWIPILSAPDVLQNVEALSDRFWAYNIVGVLPSSGNLGAANASLAVIGARLGIQRGRLEAVSAREAKIPPGLRRGLTILLAAVGLVMCAACLNAAILLFAMFESRRRELALRSSLGASAWRIARQLAIETGMIALVGAAAGFVTAALARQVIWAARPVTGAGWYQGVFAQHGADLDWRVLAYAIGVAMSGMLLVGFWPVFMTWRREHSAPARFLTGSPLQQSIGRHAGHMSRSLGAAELAVAFVLTANALLLVQGFLRLQREDFGFTTDRVLMAELSLPSWKYDRVRAAALYEEIESTIGALPVVSAVSFDLAPPLSDRLATSAATMNVEMPDGAGGRGTMVGYHVVTSQHLDVLGMRLLDGRSFERTDVSGVAAVALVNRAAAEQFWPGRPAVGQTIAELLNLGIEGKWEPRQIVGVLANVQSGPPEKSSGPEVYVPIAQEPPASAILFVRTAVDTDGLAQTIRESIRNLDPDVALEGVMTLEQHQAEALSMYRFSSTLLTVFGLMTLLLAAIGVYAVNANDVRSRNREFAVRMALGATGGQVTWFIVRRALVIAVAGMAVGIVGALALAQLLRSQLSALNADMFVILLLTTTVLGGIAGIAALIPAWRASRVKPMRLLRAE